MVFLANRIKFKRKPFFVELLLLLILTLNYPVLAQSKSNGLSKPIAKINDVVLTEYDLQASLNEIMPAGIFHKGFSSEKRDSYRSRAFEKMIDKELLYQESIELGMKPDKNLIDAARNDIIQKLKSEDRFQEALKQAGLTEMQYRRNLEKNELSKKMIAIEIDDKANVSDKVAKKHYLENKSRYVIPKAIRLRHILISVKPNAQAKEKALLREKARQVLDRIKAGEDMASLASMFSDDRYRIKGGDYGFIHKGRLDPELEKEVMKLEINTVSSIIQTRFGFHIARVEAIRPPTQLNYDEISQKIKMKLSEDKKKKLKKDFITRLRKTAQIIIY